MRSAIERRDVLGALVILGLATLLAATAHEAIRTAFERQIIADAEITGAGWVRYIAANLDEVDGIAAGKTPSVASLRFMQQASHVGNVTRFKLFDPTGLLRFVSDDPFRNGDTAPTLGKHNAKAAKVVLSGRPYTEVVEGNGPDEPPLHAESYLPIVKDGRIVAIAEVDVDQTAKYNVITETFRETIFFTVLLLVAGFGVPAAAFYVRTRQKDRAEVETAENGRRLDVVLANMSQGFCMFGADRRLVLANEQYMSLYNLPPECTVEGTSVREVLELRVANGVYAGDDPAAYVEERIRCVDEGQYKRVIHRLLDGRVLAVTHKPLPDGGWLTTHDDITELQRIEERITHLAHHDAVTGLPNRISLRDRILAKCNGGQRFALLCLDLDHFKSVNDTLGHPVGDLMLKSVAGRLKACVSEDDTVARLGGDEFAIIHASAERPGDASALATRICEVLGKPFDLDGHQVVVGVSIGIAVAPADGQTPDDLLKNADLALYRAKEDDRGSFRFFEAEMGRRMQERRQMEIDLRAALCEGQFDLLYQPLIEARTNTISGFEALLRWNHPDRGVTAPADFIPLAEEIGLIVPLGEWVVREACAQAAKWPDHIRIAVNISAAQFRSGKLVPMIINALSATGLSPSRLELEITEAILLQYSQSTLQTLHMLRNLGVRIVLDDFGTGNSSLSYLRSFPFDKLKIDGSFFRDAGDNAESQAIIRTIARLGNSLGMTTTAEGVETEEQLARVVAEGCGEIQGFLYSPPVRPDEVAERFFPRRRNVSEVA
jgi:diguanylate cyclase (GGDEF)-like protein